MLVFKPCPLPTPVPAPAGRAANGAIALLAAAAIAVVASGAAAEYRSPADCIAQRTQFMRDCPAGRTQFKPQDCPNWTPGEIAQRCERITRPAPTVAGRWESNHGPISISQPAGQKGPNYNLTGVITYKNGGKGNIKGISGWCDSGAGARICQAGRTGPPYLFVQFDWWNASGRGNGVLVGTAEKLDGGFTQRQMLHKGEWQLSVPPKSGAWNLRR